MSRQRLEPPRAEPAEPLEPEIDEDPSGEDGPRRYYLLLWSAPDDQPVIEEKATNAQRAAEQFMGSMLKALLPYPPWEDGEPPDTRVPETYLAIDHTGRHWVVGPASWPEGIDRTVGALKAAFNEQEVREFKDGWAYLEEMWPKMVGREEGEEAQP